MATPVHPTLIPLPDELRSSRIVVRPFRPDDGAALFEAIEESREHLARWLPWVARHQSPDDSRDYCIRAAANWSMRGDLPVGIFRADSGLFLGGSGLHRFDLAARTFEIGYWVRQSAEGHGYISEAVQLLAQLAFEQLAAQRVEIICDAANDRSRRVAERLGFPLEGRLRNHILDTRGRLRDTLIFALIPEDYARVRQVWRAQDRERGT